MPIAETISALLAARGVEPVLAQRLAAYGALALDANRTTNLTAARDPAAFTEHLLDALTLRGDVDGPLIDLGSGAGLPGIPLAIATGHPVVLVDSVRKKVTFLARALVELGLSGEAIAARAERLGADPAFRERFRCATARAVGSAPTVAELTVPFLAIGGKALLQRGALPERERQAVVDASVMLGADLAEERPIGGERRILVLEKRTSTPRRFPRREGVPEKRPLCFA
jgi:16S rRNA (guanine527-N7)-methyltransferase